MLQNKKLGFWDDRISEENSEGIRFIIALLGGGISLGMWVRTDYNTVWLAIFVMSVSYLVILIVQNRNKTVKHGAHKNG